MRTNIAIAAEPREIQVVGEITLRALCWGAPIATGKPGAVVLLHGLGDGADVWRPMMRAWSARPPDLAVVAFDLPGHGGSGRLKSGDYRVAVLAEIIAGALKEIGLLQPILVGHSMGGRVALSLAGGNIAGGLEPSGLVLIDMNLDGVGAAEAVVKAHIAALIAGAESRRGCIDLLLQRLPMADPAAVEDVVATATIETGGRWGFPLDASVISLFGDADPAKLWAALAEVRAPVGIVRGGYSSVLNAVTASRMASHAMRASPVEVVTKAGHAIPLEQPLALALAVGGLVASFADGGN